MLPFLIVSAVIQHPSLFKGLFETVYSRI